MRPVQKNLLFAIIPLLFLAVSALFLATTQIQKTTRTRPEASETPRLSLKDSGPITVTKNGQIVKNLRITSSGGNGITVNGFSDVVIQNVEIRHSAGHGIYFSNAPNINIENVNIIHTGSPPAGANSGLRNNIHGVSSPGAVITKARLTRGSSGVWLLNSGNAHLSFIEGHDFRGPSPRGQLVQFDKSDNSILEDFSAENPKDTSWTEDNVSMFQSSNVIVRRGLVDGNNSPSGVGIMFEQSSSRGSGGLAEDIDAVHQGNGAFAGYPAYGVTFRRTRARDNICTSQGRGAPLSNAISWAGRSDSSNLRIENSAYYALCNPKNRVWNKAVFSIIELREENFTPRQPIRLVFPWEPRGIVTPTPTVRPSPSPTPTFNPADLNQDGKVDIYDYNILVSNFGKTGSPGWIKADIDKNGTVDIFDYNVLVENFGK